MNLVFVWLDETTTPHQWRGYETRAAAEYYAKIHGRSVMDVQEMDVIEWGKANTLLHLSHDSNESDHFRTFVGGAGRLIYRNANSGIGHLLIAGIADMYAASLCWMDGVASVARPDNTVRTYTVLAREGHWWARIEFGTQHKTLPARVTVTTEFNFPDAPDAPVTIEDMARRVQSLIVEDLMQFGLVR